MEILDPALRQSLAHSSHIERAHPPDLIKLKVGSLTITHWVIVFGA